MERRSSWHTSSVDSEVYRIISWVESNKTLEWSRLQARTGCRQWFQLHCIDSRLVGHNNELITRVVPQLISITITCSTILGCPSMTPSERNRICSKVPYHPCRRCRTIHVPGILHILCLRCRIMSGFITAMGNPPPKKGMIQN
jgi:hypothetical protein